MVVCFFIVFIQSQGVVYSHKNESVHAQTYVLLWPLH